jgi:sulfur-oxidizing protein SoxA
MRLALALALALSAALAFAGAAQAAQPAAAASAPDARRSGFDFMTPQLQAMQRDDASNPAMLWVQGGEAIWNKPAGASNRSCASCHGEASRSMHGVSARYPAFDAKQKRVVDLRQRIDQCRVEHQQAAPFATESEEQLSIESFVAMQSRGLAVAPPNDPRLKPALERGEHLFMQRIGQLDLSCAQCHDDHAGQRLGGSTIPQAHPTGYPIYRLEWQGMGSLQRRLRSCMAGVRAESFPYGAQELVELELYLAKRAAGMPVDAPAVRP